MSLSRSRLVVILALALVISSCESSDIQVPSTVDLGNVIIGTFARTTLTLRNIGPNAIFIKSSTPPTSPLAVDPPGIPTRSIVPARGSLSAQVSVFPAAVGLGTRRWVFTTNQSNVARIVTFRYNGTRPSNWASPPAIASWNLVDSAFLQNGVLWLTPNIEYLIGVAWAKYAVPSNNIRISFSFKAENPNNPSEGGDGLALLFSNPSNGYSAEGETYGGAFGFLPYGPFGHAGIPHTYGVIINTFNNEEINDVSGNSVEVRYVSDPYSERLLAGSDVTGLVPSLSVGVHRLDVTIAYKRLWVNLDGTPVSRLQNLPLENLTNNTRIGFSAGTGAVTAEHKVWNVVIRAWR